MGNLNDWHDYVRVLAFFVSLYCLVKLFFRYQEEKGLWNTKTKDYWFALLMWSLGGCTLTIQGIVLDLPATPGFVFLTAAVLVTGKGLHRKGDWGGRG